jgi:peptidoglycan/xylan/chitin deacetylase (PgdA/CDA1 family)
MPLPPDHLEYPQRRHGMDHDRYGWSDLSERVPVAWPGRAKVALWVTPILQWFPLNASAKPFRAPGGLTMPYPDLRHYTSRDYGNRVGIFRILDVLDELRCPASVAMNAAVAERYPTLVGEATGRGLEILAHGQDMGTLHHGGLSPEEEGAVVARALGTLREASGQAVTGWLSPGRSQSFTTPDILAANGVSYACDWANDDMPYPMRTANGPLWAMPLAQETEDRTVLLDFHHTEDDWLLQLKDRFDTLYREADRFGGRIVSVPLHAWVAGVPYRIGIVREALSYMLGHGAVWAATGADILAAFQSASGSSDD